MFLERWCTDLDFDSEVKTLVPVWLYLPDLPKRVFSRRAIVAMAKHIGTPLLADTSSLALDSSLCARVKVLCDMASPIADGIQVEVNGFQFWQRFHLPRPCAKCKLLGHSALACASSNPIQGPNQGPRRSRGRSRSRRFPAASPDQGATARGPDLTAESNKANSDLGNMENEGRGNSNTVEDIV